MNTNFHGFPKELPDFLFELHFQNTIERQAENLVRYKALITDPLIQLYETLRTAVEQMGIPLEMRRARCISTPYTDRRFSPDAPLKEYLYLRFKRFGKSDNIPGLYFDLGAEYYSYGLRIYDQTAIGAEQLRKAVCGAPDRVSAILDKALSEGFAVIGDHYKRDRYPQMTETSAKSLISRKRFYIGKDVPVGDKVFTADLAEEISAGFGAMREFLLWMEAEGLSA